MTRVYRVPRNTYLRRDDSVAFERCAGIFTRSGVCSQSRAPQANALVSGTGGILSQQIADVSIAISASAAFVAARNPVRENRGRHAKQRRTVLAPEKESRERLSGNMRTDSATRTETMFTDA